MGACSIAEAAERSGFSPSTLRSYEKVGLLPSPPGDGPGYRSCGDDAMARLAFSGRAKHLRRPRR